MIIKTETTEVFSSGQIQSQDFTMKASAKAFKILSKSLYQNHIRAIIRELCCNAIDAHKEAGQTKKYDVQLPNRIEPIFRIRDYGTGMSHEDIMTLYTTFFESTKNMSNDFIGALGLGSKSPFSYTNSFLVSSFYHGKKTMYSMMLKDGIPTVSIMASVATEEENGIEITVAVNPDDVRVFEKEAAFVFFAFDELPNISGTTVEYVEKTPKTGYFTAHSNRNISLREGVYARMGGILYPVPKDIEYENHAIGLYHNYVFVVDFDLGELDIMPSREEVSLDDTTIKNMTKRLNAVNSIAEKEILAEYEAFDNHWSVYKVASMANGHRMKTFLGEAVSIDGMSHKQWLNDVAHALYELPSIRVYSVTEDNTKNLRLSRYDRKNIGNPFSLSFLVDAILLDDDGKGLPMSMKTLVRAGEVVSGGKIAVIDYSYKAKIDAYFKLWGGTCTKYVNSDLVQMKKDNRSKGTPVARRKRVPMPILKSNLCGDSEQTRRYELQYDDFEAYKGFAVRYNHSTCVTRREYSISDSRAGLMMFMRAVGVEEVLIVPKKYWTRFDKNPNIQWMDDALIDMALSLDPKELEYDHFKNSNPRWVNTLIYSTNLTKLVFPTFSPVDFYHDYKVLAVEWLLGKHNMFGLHFLDDDKSEKIKILNNAKTENDKRIYDMYRKVEDEQPLLVAALPHINITDEIEKDIIKLLTPITV